MMTRIIKSGLGDGQIVKSYHVKESVLENQTANCRIASVVWSRVVEPCVE